MPPRHPRHISVRIFGNVRPIHAASPLIGKDARGWRFAIARARNSRSSIEVLDPQTRQFVTLRVDSRSFFVPIYRETKTRAVFPSRYSGKAKLAQFSRPDIAGKQNSRSFLSSEFSR